MQPRTTALLAALLWPAAAQAAPVTFTFEAGDVSGRYTFDTTTPGTRQHLPDFGLADLLYPGAITAFTVSAGGFFATGTMGDVRLGVDRGPLGETWYTATMRGPGVLLHLDFFTPTRQGIITTEELGAAEVPDVSHEGNTHELSLFDDTQTTLVRRAEVTHMARLGAVPPPPTAVPEPRTWLLFAVGCAVSVWARHHSAHR